jgi:Ca-activated chloride channel family protein
MTLQIAPLPDQPQPVPGAGLGALTTTKGNLPLDAVDVHAAITGLTAGVTITQNYRNPFDVPLEATYVFPLPDRAAVTGLRMEAADRVIEGVLKERGQARKDYDDAIAEGKRAAIAEEDRPDVFTMRVGNILPGEQVTVRLTLDQPLPYEDDAATFRFPLVVAPRYIPGAPLPDAPAGDGVEPDTDAVPDASRISPPVLLPGFPNPVRLTLSVDLDPAGLPVTDIRSSLHVVATSESGDRTTIRLEPGERLNRDFILRLGFASGEASSLVLTPDESGTEGTFALSVLPARQAPRRPRDLVLLLDRSGSMDGWKIVAARRAAARIIDTLRYYQPPEGGPAPNRADGDRFAVLSFDHEIGSPPDLPDTLVPAVDRHRFRAVEHLAGLAARGGTEMLPPLQRAAGLLAGGERDRVLVLITDGQIGNEDQILRALGPALAGVRVHTVGIDRAVNAGFLNRLAAAGGGHADFVESEDRLDEAMERIHHRIAAPLVTGLSLVAEGLDLDSDTVTPGRLGSFFPGIPLVVRGRWHGTPHGDIVVRGVTPDGAAWQRRTTGVVARNPAATTVWARARLRELEDRYVVKRSTDLEKQIVDTSLRFGVLCRFTAFVAVDTRAATSGEVPHQVIQPVEFPDGWTAPGAHTFLAAAMSAPAAAAEGFVARATRRGRQSAGPLRGFGRAPRLPDAATDTDVLAQVRRRLASELETLRAAASAPEAERRSLLVAFRDRLDALLSEPRTAAVADDRFAGLSELLAELTAWIGSGDPPGEHWDRTIRTLTALTERSFWKQD